MIHGREALGDAGDGRSGSLPEYVGQPRELLVIQQSGSRAVLRQIEVLLGVEHVVDESRIDDALGHWLAALGQCGEEVQRTRDEPAFGHQRVDLREEGAGRAVAVRRAPDVADRDLDRPDLLRRGIDVRAHVGGPWRGCGRRDVQAAIELRARVGIRSGEPFHPVRQLLDAGPRPLNLFSHRGRNVGIDVATSGERLGKAPRVLREVRARTRRTWPVRLASGRRAETRELGWIDTELESHVISGPPTTSLDVQHVVDHRERVELVGVSLEAGGDERCRRRW